MQNKCNEAGHPNNPVGQKVGHTPMLKLRSAKHKISMELICEDQLIRVISTPVNNLYLLQEFIQIGFRFKHKFFA